MLDTCSKHSVTLQVTLQDKSRIALHLIVEGHSRVQLPSHASKRYPQLSTIPAKRQCTSVKIQRHTNHITTAKALSVSPCACSPVVQSPVPYKAPAVLVSAEKSGHICLASSHTYEQVGCRSSVYVNAPRVHTAH
jgi:hypothetical protein